MQSTKKAALAAAAILGTLGLQGCAYLNTGEEEFSCSGMPDSVFCRSARDVYTATNDGSVPSRVGPEGAYNPDCDDCVRSEGRNFNFGYEADEEREQQKAGGAAGVPPSKSNGNGAEKDEVVDNFVTPRLPHKPVPIRTPAVVMRIWIAPWVDDNDDLIAPGYVYTEIEPRRWIYMPAAAKTDNSKFEPLRMTSKPNRNAARQKKPGENTLEKLKEAQRAKLK